MSYSVESVNGCTKKIAFNFEALDLTTEIKAAVLKKQKSTNMKGFRKGKAPLQMIEKIYGPQLESDALNDFVQNKFFEAVTKEDLRVVGYPSFENMKYESGTSVSFDAMVEVFPTVELKDFSGLTFSKEKIEVADEEIETLKNNYLSSKAELLEVKDAEAKLEKGQTAVINFQGITEGGEKPENMKGEEFLLEIGSGQFIPGFEEGAIGMKAGEDRSIDVTFPENYQAAELQNAKVVFEVKLLEIKEKKLPEFTDELAKEFGFDSSDDFYTKNRESMTQQKNRASQEKLHQEILEKIIGDNEFDVPNTLVTQQKTYLKEDVTKTLQQQGFNEDMMTEYFEKWSDDLDVKATFQVKSGLVLDNLAKKYNVETSDSDFDAKLAEMSAGSGMEVAQVKQYYSSDEKLKKNLMYAIREEKTFEKIIEDVTVTEK